MRSCFASSLALFVEKGHVEIFVLAEDAGKTEVLFRELAGDASLVGAEIGIG